MNIKLKYTGCETNAPMDIVESDIKLAIQLFQNQSPNWETQALNNYDETVLNLMLAGF